MTTSNQPGTSREHPGPRPAAATGPLRMPGESEADFLARQQEQAKQAIKQTVAALKQNLAEGADPRLWTRQYPWLSVGVAAAAGFAAAAWLVPSKEERALRRLERIERALMPEKYAARHPHDGAGEQEDRGARQYERGRSSFMGAMGRQVLEAIKPALLSALSAGVAGKVAQPDHEDMAAAAAEGVHGPGAEPGGRGAGPQGATAASNPYPFGHPAREDREGGPPDPSAAI